MFLEFTSPSVIGISYVVSWCTFVFIRGASLVSFLFWNKNKEFRDNF